MASKRLSDDDLITILRKEEAASRQYQDGTLSPIRTTAQDYYDRMPYGDEQEGSSQVVTSEFADAIESMMPGLMEVFAGSDQIVKFAPVAAGHEQAMEEANSYVPHCFMQKNNGFLLLSATLKDALMSRLGGMAVDLDTREKTREFELNGLTQDDIDMILAEGDKQQAEVEMDLMPDGPPKVAKQAVNYSKSTGEDRCDGCAFYQGGPCARVEGRVAPDGWCELYAPRQMGAVMPVETFSGKVKVTRTVQEVVVDAIAPESILFTPTARNEDACSMLGFFKKVTASDLHKLGVKQEEIDELDSRRPLDPEEDQRTDGASSIVPERSDTDDSERPLWLVLAYVKADFDGTGESSMERILYAHAGGVAARIIERTPWDEPAAIALATPILMPHVIVGRSVFDQTKDLQQISSALTRGMLDGMYVSIRPRPAVSDKVILESLLDWVPGAPIRFQQGAKPGDGHIVWEKPPNVLPDALTALEYFNTVKENRTGTNRMSNQGLDADSLNKTKGGMQLMFSAAAQRQKLIARTFAETFVSRVYRLIYRAIKRAATGKVSYWAGDTFKQADPTKWPDDMDLTVDVGLGTGNTEQELSHLTILANVQEKLVTLQGGTGGPFVLAENVANLSQKFAEKLGFKTPGMFFQPPEKVQQASAQPQPPKPDPEMIKVQGQLEAQKAKQEGELALNAAKAQADASQRREQAAIDLQLSREKADLDMQIARERAALDAQLAREKADLDAQLKVRELDQEAALGAMEIEAQAEVQGASEQREQEVS